jgi:hypothetical protein
MFPLSRAGVAGTDWDSSPINVPATNIREWDQALGVS